MIRDITVDNPKKNVSSIFLIGTAVLIFALISTVVVYVSNVFTKQSIDKTSHASEILSPTPSPVAAPGTVNIDPQVGTAYLAPHSISQYIYGISDSAPDSTHLTQYRAAGASVVRWGGNARTRYNWEINASNAGSDYGPYCNQSKNNAAAFVSGNRSMGADSLITIPLIGWVAKNTSSCSSGVPGGGDALIKYPTPGWETGAISGYDPTTNRNNTSVQALARKGSAFSLTPTPGDNRVYMDEWVNSMKAQFGAAESGGVRFYDLDNESDLWADDTHADVHPARLGYDEELYRITDYADAIKDVDPTAKILAPVGWSWPSYWYSARDQYNGNSNDHDTHANLYHIQWLLRSVKQHDLTAGRRSLDAVDIHWYPQNGVVPGDESQAATRLQLARGLWDPTYTYPGWMGSYMSGASVIRYIPRLRELIAQEYPGTKIAITEWNFGSENAISGGLSAADVLGVYGKEDLYLATYWPWTDSTFGNTPIGFAWKMYRNYNGADAKFGDTSIKAQTATQDYAKISVFASKDSTTGELKVMLINKQPSTTMPLTLNFNNYNLSGMAQVYRYSSANLTQIVRQADLPVAGTSIPYSLPAYSVTLLVLPADNSRPTATPDPSASVTPTVIPTAVPTSNPTPTSIPSGNLTVTFDEPGHPADDSVLTGQYPTGALDWGTTAYFLHSAPWQLFTTNSMTFRSGSVTSGTFTVMSGRYLSQLRAYNGGSGSTTVTISCPGQTTKTVSIASGTIQTIATNWTGCTGLVTLSNTNAWATNFDDFVLSGSTGTSPTPTVLPTAAQTPSPTVVTTPTATPIPDPTAPTVSITSPLNGATVSRGSTTSIQATANDNVGVTKVEFYVDTTLKCTDTVAPYTCNWTVPSKPRVTYSLKAKAYDAANNSVIYTINVRSK